VFSDQTCKDRGDERSNVWSDVETGVLQQGGQQLHHLSENEQALEVVCDLVSHELNKVGYQLMETRIGSQTGKGGDAELFVGLVQNGTADAFEV
jgi:hypothetical protein